MPLGHIPVLLQDEITDRQHTKCYVFGPYGSGTNLLRAYLEKHFNCECKQNHTVWKHVFDWELGRCSRPPVSSPVLRLVVLKHPIFWMASMVKSPYNFHSADGSTFTEPCKELSWSRRGSQKTFPDAMSYWEATVLHYLEDPYFKVSTYLVLYEDLLYRPVAILRQLSHLLYRTQEAFGPIYTSAKNHCNASDRAKALRKYTLRNREAVRQQFRFPKERADFVLIWRPSDIWIANAQVKIKKDRAESMKNVSRSRDGRKKHFLQKFDGRGLLI